MLLLSILGLLVGTVMGLTGAGGGILAVPALMFALDGSLTEVAPIALLAVATSAAIGAWGGWRQGLVRYRAATLMAVVGVPFTALGGRLGAMLDARQLSWMFVAVLFYVGVRQAYRLTAEQLPLAENQWRPLDASSGRIAWSRESGAVAAAIGGCVGFASGLLGVGGGFIMVPLLQRFSNMSIQSIIATALMVIALVSGGGAAMALAHGASMPPSIVLPFVGAATLGMLTARRAANLLPARQLQIGFAVLVFIVAGAVTIDTLAK